MDISEGTLTDPSDWKFKPLRDLDTLFRCTICFDYYQAAMSMPSCSHNYCSVCIRRFLKDRLQCPTCSAPATVSKLKNNRILDDLVKQFTGDRRKYMDLVNGTRSKNRLRGPHSSHQPSGMRIESRNIAVRSDECGSDSSEVRGVARVPEPPSLQSLGESIAIMEEEEKGEEEEARRREGREVTHEVFGPVLAGCTPAGGVQDGFTSLGTHEHPSLPRPTTLSTSGSPATVFPGPSPSPTYSPESPSILTQTGRPCELASGSETPSRPPADLSGPIRSATTEGGNGGGSSGMEEVSFPSLAVATKVACPICGVSVIDKYINSHLDTCLSKTARQQAYTSPSPGQHLPRLPKLCIDILTSKQLGNKLKEYHLSTQGSRNVKISRLREFMLQYNAQCDSLNPKTPEQIAMEVEKAEEARLSTKASTPRQPPMQVHRHSSKQEIEKQRVSYELEHSDHFSTLIAKVREQRKQKVDHLPRTPRVRDREKRQMGRRLAGVDGGMEGGNSSVVIGLGKVREEEGNGEVLVVESSDSEGELVKPVVPIQLDMIPESPCRPKRERSKRKCKQAVSTSFIHSSDSEVEGDGEEEEWEPDFEPATPSFGSRKRPRRL